MSSRRRRSGSSRSGSQSNRRRGGAGGVREIFDRVDTNRSGSINARELQAALSNGSWEPFSEATTCLFIRMFDRNGDNVLSFSEFKQLWNYLQQWTETFRRFDTDGSGPHRPLRVSTGPLRLRIPTLQHRLRLPAPTICHHQSRARVRPVRPSRRHPTLRHRSLQGPRPRSIRHRPLSLRGLRTGRRRPRLPSAARHSRQRRGRRPITSLTPPPSPPLFLSANSSLTPSLCYQEFCSPIAAASVE